MQQIKIGDKSYDIQSQQGNSTRGEINGDAYELNVVGNEHRMSIIRNNKSYQVNLVRADYESKTFVIRVNSTEYTLEAKDRFDLLLEELGMEDLAASSVNDLKAPMPGMVLRIDTKVGEAVKKGQPLLVLEAMKMENVLKAESDATVKAIHGETGKAVEKNQVLIEFEA